MDCRRLRKCVSLSFGLFHTYSWIRIFEAVGGRVCQMHILGHLADCVATLKSIVLIVHGHNLSFEGIPAAESMAVPKPRHLFHESARI